MTRIGIHPSYTRDDFREPEELEPSMREERTTNLWVDEAGLDHDDDRHGGVTHPFCAGCGYRTLELVDPEPSRWTAAEQERFWRSAERTARSRALRFLRLYGKRPTEVVPEPLPPFDFGNLAELLTRPQEPAMRVEGLIPSDASTLLVAQRKAGKTTTVLNYARSLLTGENFLGSFEVVPVAGKVALLNYEVSGHTIARWADEHGVPADRLFVVNLRGRRNPLTHPEDRAALAEVLRLEEVEVLIVDPFGRAYTGKSQNDAGEVGAWLVDLDTFTRSEVGASDLVLTVHAGWNGERTRGSSALEDWADVVVTLTRDADEESSARYLRAFGRDVDLDEDRLDFDAATRRLTLSGTGSRKKGKDEKKLAELAVLVVRAAREQPGISYNAAENAIRGMDENQGFRKGDVAKAAQLARANGLLHIGNGARGACSLVALDPTSPSSPHVPPGQLPTSPTSPYRGEVEVKGPEQLDLPRPLPEAL